MRLHRYMCLGLIRSGSFLSYLSRLRRQRDLWPLTALVPTLETSHYISHYTKKLVAALNLLEYSQGSETCNWRQFHANFTNFTVENTKKAGFHLVGTREEYYIVVWQGLISHITVKWSDKKSTSRIAHFEVLVELQLIKEIEACFGRRVVFDCLLP